MGLIEAIVTVNKEQAVGGVPIFYAADQEKMQETAFLLEKILDASVHDLKNGTLLLVNHR